MMMRAPSFFAIAGLIFACLHPATAAAADDVLRPVYVNKNAGFYNEKEIVVDGILLFDLPRNNHLNAIYESRVRRIYSNLRWKFLRIRGYDWRDEYRDRHPDQGCITVVNPQDVWDQVPEPRYKRVRVKGIFYKNYEDAGFVLDSCATGTGMVVTDLIKVW